MVLGVTLLYSLLHLFYVSFGSMKAVDIPLLLVRPPPQGAAGSSAVVPGIRP